MASRVSLQLTKQLHSHTHGGIGFLLSTCETAWKAIEHLHHVKMHVSNA
jgi:hypothetical protein